MNSEDIFDKMNLPLTSSNEDLETVSGNLFRQLFDVEKFEIRPEPVRDKGIDFHIELKKQYSNGSISYLNFRFAVQLKATESKGVNQDGSISLQLHTSNINYLLNSGMPAFYVLYVGSTQSFYYENVNEFVRKLSEKGTDWNSQMTHTLRFERLLDKHAIDGIYQATLKRGIFQRAVNDSLIAYSLPSDNGDKILIDPELNISDDAKIREMVEQIGFEKINERKWLEIIDLHKQASGAVASSAKYNLVLGVANYYAGHLTEALPFFKKATGRKAALDDVQRNLLRYFEDVTKFSMGLLSETEYKNRMDKLSEVSSIGLHIRLEVARERYAQEPDTQPGETYEKYVAEIETIMNHPNADDSVRLAADCELILIKGNEVNTNMVRGVAWLKVMESQGAVPHQLRLSAAQRFRIESQEWYQHIARVRQLALEQKNRFIYYSSFVHEVKISYEQVVDLIVYVEEAFKPQAANMPDKTQRIQKLLDKIREASGFFERVGHIENHVVCLLSEYELLRFLEDNDAATMVINQMVELIEANELGEKREKLKQIKDNGTTYEQVKAQRDSIFGKNESGK